MSEKGQSRRSDHGRQLPVCPDNRTFPKGDVGRYFAIRQPNSTTAQQQHQSPLQ
jgi:hypothetical protein